VGESFNGQGSLIPVSRGLDVVRRRAAFACLITGAFKEDFFLAASHVDEDGEAEKVVAQNVAESVEYFGDFDAFILVEADHEADGFFGCGTRAVELGDGVGAAGEHETGEGVFGGFLVAFIAFTQPGDVFFREGTFAADGSVEVVNHGLEGFQLFVEVGVFRRHDREDASDHAAKLIGEHFVIAEEGFLVDEGITDLVFVFAQSWLHGG